MTRALTGSEVLALPAMVDVGTAARALNIGRTTAYQLVRTDSFPCPVIKIGGAWRVPSAGLRRLLGLDDAHGDDGHPNGSTTAAALALDGAPERGSERPPADSTTGRVVHMPAPVWKR